MDTVIWADDFDLAPEFLHFKVRVRVHLKLWRYSNVLRDDGLSRVSGQAQFYYENGPGVQWTRYTNTCAYSCLKCDTCTRERGLGHTESLRYCLRALPPKHAACMLARTGEVLFGERPIATKMVRT